MVDRNHPTQKLTPKFAGPFPIISIISSTAYKLELPATMKIHPVFHISLLKRYNTSDEFSRTTPPPPVIIPTTHEEEYEVEAILDKKIVRRRPQYLIKWLGYSLYDATWEPLENLSNAQEKLKDFESTRTSDS